MAKSAAKHLRIRESNELGGVTRYHGLCGASGLNSREYPKDMSAMNCPKCYSVAKMRRIKIVNVSHSIDTANRRCVV